MHATSDDAIADVRIGVAFAGRIDQVGRERSLEERVALERLVVVAADFIEARRVGEQLMHPDVGLVVGHVRAEDLAQTLVEAKLTPLHALRGHERGDELGARAEVDEHALGRDVVSRERAELADRDGVVFAREVRLDWAAVKSSAPHPRERPWERGGRLARELRTTLGLAAGPISREMLEQLLDARLPLAVSTGAGGQRLSGGYRNGIHGGRTALLVTKRREDSQRFYLARLIGAACSFNEHEHVLAVSDAATAFQKLERAFAQEFLCPWKDLDAFTDESGMDDDAIAEAAGHFGVSELLVLSALVNHGKLSRTRLPI